MFVKYVSAFAVCMVATMAAVVPVEANDAAAAEVVQYRLTDWQSVHADGVDQAKELVTTLKQLRCEVKMDRHGGHIDIHYRCPKWQALELKTHDLAHQWETWLKKHKFQTKHIH